MTLSRCNVTCLVNTDSTTLVLTVIPVHVGLLALCAFARSVITCLTSAVTFQRTISRPPIANVINTSNVALFVAVIAIRI